MAVAGRSGQWEEGSGRRRDVGQWIWEERRRICRLVYCFFIFLFANGEFNKFGLSGMEGGSRGVVIITLQVSFGGGRGGRMGLVKGVIMDMFHAS